MNNKFDKEIEKLYGIVEQIDDTTYIVKKEKATEKISFERGKYYLIRIDGSDTSRNLLKITATNWNAGREIESDYLKCEYLESLGNMIKINGSGYSPSTDTDKSDIYLNYWIDSSVVEIVKELR